MKSSQTRKTGKCSEAPKNRKIGVVPHRCFLTVPPRTNHLGWGATFRDLTMPIFEGPKIDFLGGGRLFETLRCQFVKARKSIFWVGDHFSRPYDANFLRSSRTPSTQIKCPPAPARPICGFICFILFPTLPSRKNKI